MFTAIDALEYPELHDESIPTLAFTRALNKLLLAAGIKDFTLQASRVQLLLVWWPATQWYSASRRLQKAPWWCHSLL